MSQKKGRETISPKPFHEAMAASGAFLEHARVFDRRYGTSRAAVESRLAAGSDLILEIDWQGARQIRERFPAAIGIFILPPSIDVLRARLEKRAQDAVETIESRMRAARSEISHVEEFDFVVVNDDLRNVPDVVANDWPLRTPGDARPEQFFFARP